MWHQFTAAAQRALIYASGWSNRTGCDELEVEPLLVGLLSEPECRAAIILKKSAIGIPTVRQRWPNLTPSTPPPQWGSTPKSFAQDVKHSLQLARTRLAMLPQPLELATEHILLGLVAADHEVAVWLRKQGLDADALEADILQLYGHRTASLDAEEGETEQNQYVAAAKPMPCLRVLDAAANRAHEGLRVIEDYVRFILDDRLMTTLCKQLRHDLTDALASIPMEHRLAARETQADVGTALSTAAEQSREDVAGVLAANFARLQESLRTLEEFGKLNHGDLAATVKQLRYRSYTLQRAIDITRGSIERLASARLYVLLDGRPSIDQFEQLARTLIEAGVHVIQLRDKQLGDRALLERARLLRHLTQNVGQVGNLSYRPFFILNDRPDLAVLAQADGVHIGQNELSVKDTRSIVGPEMLVGVSTHSIEQARQSVLDGANYIGVGPTFPSDTKSFEQFTGVELLRHVAAEIRLPAFAIGGIGRQNIDQVLATGMTRIAVCGAVTEAEDPGQVVEELIETLNDKQR